MNKGDVMPAYERPITAVDLVAYGAATWDWHRLHYDQSFVQSVKLPAPVVDGQMFGAVFAKAAIDWLGPRAFIRRLVLKNRAMVFAGDTVRVEGEAAEVRDDDANRIVTVAARLKTGDRLAAEATMEIRLPRG